MKCCQGSYSVCGEESHVLKKFTELLKCCFCQSIDLCLVLLICFGLSMFKDCSWMFENSQMYKYKYTPAMVSDHHLGRFVLHKYLRR